VEIALHQNKMSVQHPVQERGLKMSKERSLGYSVTVVITEDGQVAVNAEAFRDGERRCADSQEEVIKIFDNMTDIIEAVRDSKPTHKSIVPITELGKFPEEATIEEIIEEILE
jgi:hypothetical protein